MRRRAGKSGFAPQRLKRLPSIVSKLQRLPRLRLSEIQDIGGCRVVVPTADDASNVASDLMESRIRHELVRYRASQTEGATGIRNRRQLGLIDNC